MKTILKFCKITILLAVMFQSCKSTHTTSTKHHFVSDTLSRTEQKLIQLPVNYTNLSAAYCKNDSLIVANQALEIGNLKIHIKSLNGKLAIEIEKPADTTTISDTYIGHTEIIDEKTDKLEIRYKLYKWVWWLIIIVAFYVAYRIARIYFPMIKFLPY